MGRYLQANLRKGVDYPVIKTFKKIVESYDKSATAASITNKVKARENLHAFMEPYRTAVRDIGNTRDLIKAVDTFYKEDNSFKAFVDGLERVDLLSDFEYGEPRFFP